MIINNLIRLSFIKLLFLTMVVQAETNIQVQSFNNFNESLLASLKNKITSTKLLPEPIGIGNTYNDDSKSVSIDGNRAIVGEISLGGSGAVIAYEFNGEVWEQASLIQPTNGISGDNFGFSVSLSGDRALIGATGVNHLNEDNAGVAYIFDYDGENWIQSGKLTASDSAQDDYFGTSVMLQGDLAIVGAPRNNNQGFNSGSVYVFDFENSVWTESSKLNANEGKAYDFFGHSLSLSNNRLLIGAYGDDDNGSRSGAAYLYEFDGNNWLFSVKLKPEDGDSLDQFGYSVSLSGEHALIGAYGDGNYSGSTYLYTLIDGIWSQSRKFINYDKYNEHYGYSVIISGDVVMIGVLVKTNQPLISQEGIVSVYNFNGTEWIYKDTLIPDPDYANRNFGQSFGISGNHALVGGKSGVFGFSNVENIWTQNTILRNSSSGAAYDNFGFSVSISGNRALVGAYKDNANEGSAYIFDYDGENWIKTVKLRTEEEHYIYNFGESVSLSGNRALIGASESREFGEDSGSAFIFEFNGEEWRQTAKLNASDASSYDYFGSSLSLDGNRAVIGAIGNNDNGSDSGSAYVFDFIKGNWIQSEKLNPAETSPYDYFGKSVSLSNNRILVGAYKDDSEWNNSGSVYVFDYDGKNWINSNKLTANIKNTQLQFGASISLSENRALIGATGDNENGYDSGAAYIFDFDGSTWTQTAKLMADDGELLDNFGTSVSLLNNRALIGSHWDDDNGSASGSAYIFDYNGGLWGQTLKLTTNDNSQFDYFGSSVSLGSSGFALIGAFGDDDHGTDSGSAYIVHFDPIFNNNFE